jgi:hypothetical protein
MQPHKAAMPTSYSCWWQLLPFARVRSNGGDESPTAWGYLTGEMFNYGSTPLMEASAEHVQLIRQTLPQRPMTQARHASEGYRARCFGNRVSVERV